MEIRKIKSTLSITLDPYLHQKLKNQVSPREVSQFVERAIAKELGEYEEKITTEQKQFQQKLIVGYKRSAQSKSLKKESKIWDEIVGEVIK